MRPDILEAAAVVPRMIAAGLITIRAQPAGAPGLSKRERLNLAAGLTARGTPRKTRWASRTGLSNKILGHVEYMRQWRALRKGL